MTRLAAVTRADRGIGLAMCKNLKAKGYHVIGACRWKSPALEALNLEIVEGVDVGASNVMTNGCGALKSALGSRKVDLLVCDGSVPRECAYEDRDLPAKQQIQANSMGPMYTYLALRSNLAEGSKVAVITSPVGSSANNPTADVYSMAKAGVIALGAQMAKDLKKHGIAVAILYPGLVLTDETLRFYGMNGVPNPEETHAPGFVKVIEERLTMETTGTIWCHDGDTMPAVQPLW